ncbi:hypothetical protein B0H10DRAFT_1963633 [Mycena sp. CBHHK59/15]|nr:hypothetical protein B0H10DRAFT_1963633 [Mycena sp. CBHHK59/15]
MASSNIVCALAVPCKPRHLVGPSDMQPGQDAGKTPCIALATHLIPHRVVTACGVTAITPANLFTSYRLEDGCSVSKGETRGKGKEGQRTQWAGTRRNCGWLLPASDIPVDLDAADAAYVPTGDADSGDDITPPPLIPACGPSKACKINLAGELSNPQQHSWTCSLAAGTHLVALTTPLKDDLFGMFFKSFGRNQTVHLMMGPGMGALGSFMAMSPYCFIPWGFPGAAPFNLSEAHQLITPVTLTPVTPTAPTCMPQASMLTLPSTFPSSDPSDMGALNPYPKIDNFLHKLDAYHPSTQLPQHQRDSEAQMFEELAHIVGITPGNTTFILTHGKAEMKWVDCEIWER